MTQLKILSDRTTADQLAKALSSRLFIRSPLNCEPEEGAIRLSVGVYYPNTRHLLKTLGEFGLTFCGHFSESDETPGERFFARGKRFFAVDTSRQDTLFTAEQDTLTRHLLTGKEAL